jgi:hypothetical protein
MTAKVFSVSQVDVSLVDCQARLQNDLLGTPWVFGGKSSCREKPTMLFSDDLETTWGNEVCYPVGCEAL